MIASWRLGWLRVPCSVGYYAIMQPIKAFMRAASSLDLLVVWSGTFSVYRRETTPALYNCSYHQLDCSRSPKMHCIALVSSMCMICGFSYVMLCVPLSLPMQSRYNNIKTSLPRSRGTREDRGSRESDDDIEVYMLAHRHIHTPGKKHSRWSEFILSLRGDPNRGFAVYTQHE